MSWIVTYIISILLIVQFKVISASSVDSLACRFKYNLCDWKNDTNGWRIGSYDAKDSAIFGKPAFKSAYLRYYGGYIYTEDSPGQINRIISKPIDLERSFCFRFVYYMFGSDVGQLTVALIEDVGTSGTPVETEIWKRQGSHIDGWAIGQYQFKPSDKPSKVRIVFKINSANIALGPIKVENESCSTLNTENLCDFEDLSSCLWSVQPSKQRDYLWFVSDGQSSGDSFIKADTSSGTGFGKFLRTPSDASLSVSSEVKTVLTTDLVSPSQVKCLRFNLYKPSQSSDVIDVSYKDRGIQSKVIWSSSAIEAESNWQAVHVAIEVPAETRNFKILLTASKHSGGNNTAIAIDDLQLNPQECTNIIDCSFSDGICNLTILTGPLLVGFGRLSHPEIFPRHIDAVKQDPRDYFIYTDTPKTPEIVTSSFISPLLPSTKISCLSFKYFIESNSSESSYPLEVIIADSAYKPKVQVGRWSQAEYTFASLSNYRVQFNLTGSYIFGAIDDIKLSNGECSKKTPVKQSKAYLEDTFETTSDWLKVLSNWEFKRYERSDEAEPRADPFGETIGSYISLSDKKENQVDTGLLQSVNLDKGFYCLSIWYWCTTNDVGELNIAMVDSSTNVTTLINAYCDNPGHWKLTEASFTAHSDYRIKVHALVESKGVLAVDRLTIFNGPCYHDQVVDSTCTFDDGTDCGIDVVISPFYNWRVKQGSEMDPPMADRSTNTLNGKFLALNLNPPAKVKSRSYFYLANLRKEDNYCLSFSYLIKGDSNLQVWKTENNNLASLGDPLEIYTGLYGSSWLKVALQIDNVVSETDIVFGGSYRKGSSGLIAIDDLTITRGECVKSHECDFESQCSWTYLPRDRNITIDGDELDPTRFIDWNYGVEADQESYLYPGKDHTLKSKHGHYAITRSVIFHRSFIVSPMIYLEPDENSLCLKFAYNTISRGIEIMIEQHEGVAYVAASIDDTKENSWLEFSQTIDLIKTHPNRIVRVYIANKKGVYAAIDDLSVAAGICPQEEESQSFTCSDGTKISLSKRCDFTKDCKDGTDELNCGNCEFELSTCGYSSSDKTQWKLTGGVIALEPKVTDITNDKLVSPLIQRSSPTCKLEFSFGSEDSDKLTVSMSFGSKEVQIWDSEYISSKLHYRNKVSISLGRIDSPFRLTFFGKILISAFRTEGIVIDYIHLTDCDFADISGSNYFTCSNGKHILTSQVCDTEVDCEGGEDEANCKYHLTNFEQGTLFPWSNDDEGKNKWLVVSGSGLISIGPNYDHSRRLPSGSYATLSPVKFSIDSETDTSASLVGPQLSSTTSCTLTFYYYLTGDPFSIQVLVKNDQQNKLARVVNETTSFGFKKVTIPLETNLIKPPFQFVIRGVQHNRDAIIPYLAIDDISLSSGCYEKMEPITTQSTPKVCSGDQFYCTLDDKCIENKRKCDYVSDCSNGEDEKQCGTCYFTDNDLCGWTDEGSSIWLPLTRYEGQQEGLPLNMISLDSFLAVSVSRSRGQAILRSPKLSSTSSLCTLKFKYYLTGESNLTIKLLADDLGRLTVAREIEHHRLEPSFWTESEISLADLYGNHYVQFVSDVSNSEQFIVPIGLADFNLIHCDPSKVNLDSFNCTLDQDFCGWKDDNSERISWNLMKNSRQEQSKFGFGKYSNRDHPSFIYLNVSSTDPSSLIKTLTSPWQYAYEDHLCFSFDYRLLSSAELSLNLLIETPDNQEGKSVFMRNAAGAIYGWNSAKVSISDLKEFRLIFKVSSDFVSPDSLVFLDNFSLTNGLCTNQQTSCDFSTGTCDWDIKNWKIEKRQLVASQDGTHRDYYLQHTGDAKGNLTYNLPIFKSTKCLSFWYYHAFDITSNLKVHLLEHDKIISTDLIPYHETSNIWTYYLKSLVLNDGYKILIETVPLGSQDSVGVDDLTLTSGPCNSPGNCDFERDSCGWKSVTDLKWRRNLGLTPSTDNLLADSLNFAQQGWFMFVAANDLSNGQAITLQSPMLTLTSPFCLTFNYIFMSDNSLLKSKLEIKSLDVKVNSLREVDTLTDNGTVKWCSYQKTIITNSPFKILLIASSDKNSAGDIAIDDIKFISGKCKSDEHDPTPKSTPKPIPTTTATVPSIDPTSDQDIVLPTLPPIIIPDRTVKIREANNSSHSTLIAMTVIAIVSALCISTVYYLKHYRPDYTERLLEYTNDWANKVYDVDFGPNSTGKVVKSTENCKIDLEEISETSGL